MSKAILVMDMPKNCFECPLRYEADQFSLGDFKYQKLFRCLYMPEDIQDVYLKDIMSRKQDWCPLKPMPEKKEPEHFSVSPLVKKYFTGYNRGWNACIDAIGGNHSE